MEKRPYISFAEVKEKVPIPDALAVLGILDPFDRRQDVLTGVCPLPSHKHGPSPNAEQFKINRKDGVWLWHCFGDCSRGGDVIELVKAMTGYDDRHVRFWFAEHFGDRLTLDRPKADSAATSHNEGASSTNETVDATADAKQQTASVAKDATTSAADAAPPLKPLRFFLNLDRAVPYLRERGLTDETIERFGLGLCRRGALAGYVAIPVYGHPHPQGANPLAYLGRWPGEDYDEEAGRPRYKWPDGFPKNQVVYGLGQALADDDGQPLIVVEGPFKVYHLSQTGFPNTVATCGSSLSDEQAQILIGTDRPIVLMFDGNEAGHSGMRAAAGKLIKEAFVRVVRLPEGTEPDDLDQQQLAHYLSFAARPQ